ncbi:hypothetical protein EJ08DRAFT_524192 [Tothia fuscella]|uniref:Transmembrane protein n=1 Tax=Tothia fuscella TaxID=1048955 RepID=A0A9P4NGX0_9PEZI|nr:hypothetical protein EJ08DRAFT_524192 [Tothia fuscella]
MLSRRFIMSAALAAVSLPMSQAQTGGTGGAGGGGVIPAPINSDPVTTLPAPPTPTPTPTPEPPTITKPTTRENPRPNPPTLPTQVPTQPPPPPPPPVQNPPPIQQPPPPVQNNSPTTPIINNPPIQNPSVVINPGNTPTKIATAQVTQITGQNGQTTLQTLFIVGGSTFSAPPPNMPITKAADSVLPVGSAISVTAGETLLYDSVTIATLTSGQSFIISNPTGGGPKTTSLGPINNHVSQTSKGLTKTSGIAIGVTFGFLTIALIASLVWCKRRNKSKKEKQHRRDGSSIIDTNYRSDKGLVVGTPLTPPANLTAFPTTRSGKRDAIKKRDRPFSFIPSPTVDAFPTADEFTATNTFGLIVDKSKNSSVAPSSTAKPWAEPTATGDRIYRVEAPKDSSREVPSNPVSPLSLVSPLEPVSPVDEETVEWAPQKPTRYYAQNAETKKRETVPNPLSAHPVGNFA